MRSIENAIFILTICIACILIPASVLAQANGDYGLSPAIQNRILGVETDYTRMVRERAPQFRLVRTVESLPEIKGKTVLVPIKLTETEQAAVNRPNSPPVIATLHDRRTGRPLDNCAAPCVLTSPLKPLGRITMYRYGSKPLSKRAKTYAFRDKPRAILLGFNEVDHQIERERCGKEFSVLTVGESTRDAEPCVRVKPLIPAEARRSGHCIVKFNILENGDPIDVRADECSLQVFCEPTTEAVRRWIYYPRIAYGKTAVRTGLESKINFRLLNSRGQFIPERDDDMQPCVGSV